jgi:aspartyl protease
MSILNLKWLVALTLAAVSLSVVNAEPHCPGNVNSLPLRLVQHSQIVVPITINHAGPYDFLVDTGAQITTIDPSLASELHLKLQGTTGVVNVGFRTRSSFAQLDLLEAGSHAMANPFAVVQNLDRLQAADPHIRGILGGNFLRHFDVFIDYPHGLLCLDDTQAMQSKVKGEHIALVSAPHSDSDTLSTEPLIVQAHLSGIEAQKKLLLLDSGSNAPLLYDAGRLVRGLVVSAPLHSRNADGVEQAFTVLPPQDMQIGTHEFRQISFVTPIATGKDVPKLEVDGLLPTILFQRVYISYADRYAVLDPW